MIRFSHDLEADALRLSFGPDGAYCESEEVAPGVILDFDAAGEVIGIEVLYVAKREGLRQAQEVVNPEAKRDA